MPKLTGQQIFVRECLTDLGPTIAACLAVSEDTTKRELLLATADQAKSFLTSYPSLHLEEPVRDFVMDSLRALGLNPEKPEESNVASALMKLLEASEDMSAGSGFST